MAAVTLHVYDVTNSMNVRANSAILNLNKVMRNGIGVGGIFHGAVQVYDEEWSFGFCETGSGVFSCPPKANPMYTYRESVQLGNTELSPMQVHAVLTSLSREWRGDSYDLLSRNCNHFCEEFCSRLGVQKLPLWVNRFANAGGAAIEVADITLERLRQAKAEVLSASKSAMRFVFGPAASTSGVSPDIGQDSPGNSRRFSFSRSPSQLLPRNSPISSQKGRSETQNNRMSSDSGSSVIFSAMERTHIRIFTKPSKATELPFPLIMGNPLRSQPNSTETSPCFY